MFRHSSIVSLASAFILGGTTAVIAHWYDVPSEPVLLSAGIGYCLSVVAGRVMKKEPSDE